nr:caspase family protein [uncultured Rhodopila sp.]
MGGCLTALPTAAQTVRALVLGIDAYEHVQQLGGADNDARLLARALAPPVARNVTLMLDQQVHRNAVLKAMDALVDDSAPGDAVIVTYSGHGAREQVPLSEDPQGFRLFWVMVDFDQATAAGLNNRILSSEIRDWLDRARARKVRVILLADNCHSGRMYRSIGVDLPRIRALPLLRSANLPADARPPFGAATKEPPPPPGLTSLAGEKSSDPVTEVRVPQDGQNHGALSFAFADALMSHRDVIAPNHDGKVLQGALLEHLQDVITALSDGRQDPQLRSVDPDDTVLFTLPMRNGEADSGGTPSGPDAPVALHIANVTSAAGQAMAAGIAGAIWEPDPAKARLVWRISPGDKGTLVNELNMFVSFDVKAAEMPATIGAFQAVQALAREAVDSRMHIARIVTDGASKPIYFGGDRLTLRVDGLAGRNLVVFNIARDGTVQHLYPDPRYYPPVSWPSAWFEFPRIDVTPPFGADHVVAVSSPDGLADLDAEIRRLDGTPDAKAARKAVERQLNTTRSARLAVAGLFTAPPDLRCDAEVIQNASMLEACSDRSR